MKSLGTWWGNGTFQPERVACKSQDEEQSEEECRRKPGAERDLHVLITWVLG